MSVRNLLAQKPYHKLRVDLSSTNITTAAWAELSASLSKPCVAVQIYYTGEGILRLSKGDAGQETAEDNELALYITPGGEGCMVPLEIAKGKRLSARALDQNVTSGDLVINFFG